MQLEAQFKVMWANHGDEISRQYAGTGALKSGFTRTGECASVHQLLPFQAMSAACQSCLSVHVALQCICHRKCLCVACWQQSI